ncbi:hypothetical protein PISL3812_01582 [Talaromyces islandicus]|uniref:Histone H4 n=1 Tax=Talaromyces islandicus TaxID=28573 RepID=A0A0U1LMI1_TALIS|nr:hypothetical protein PISL3812_01582 [Talaromyces islandicus]
MPTSLGLGLARPKRTRRKLNRDSILGITNNFLFYTAKPAIRRLARRGGVVRMSTTIYDEIRKVVQDRLEKILRHLVAVLESSSTPRFERKTVTTRDVVFVLNRMGSTIYGFGPV